MKKKWENRFGTGGRLTGILAMALCLGLFFPSAASAAVQTQEELETQALKSLGLFSGSGFGDQLNRQPLRIEGTVMLLRLLGQEAEAEKRQWAHPFTDVPKWGDSYVGYAYVKGISAGVSDREFGAESGMSRSQYLTLLLRALGYQEEPDSFLWDSAESFAVKIGLLDQASGKADGKVEFSRGDLVRISWRALSVREKGSDQTLAEDLLEKGIFPREQYDAAVSMVQAGPKEVRAVYLTFDDGPNQKVTPRVLDILNQYDIKATFFVVGKQVDANPQMLQRIDQEGHRIGNHSYDHVYKTLYQDSNALLSEIRKNDASINQALGYDYKNDLFRFPGGSGGKSQALKDAVTEAGYRYYDWNCSGQDAAKKGGSTAAEISQSVKDTTRSKGDVTVLLHDAASKSTTADALPEIISWYLNQGFVFRTLGGPGN